MRLKRALRNYFTFNRREQRGIAALLVLLLLLFSVRLSMRYTTWFEGAMDEGNAQVMLESAQAIASEDSFMTDPEKQSETTQWATFDPNELSVEGFIEFGLRAELANRLDKYRSKGGRFFSVSDVERIYGMDSSWLDQASAFMVFPESKTYQPPAKSEVQKAQPQRFDLNRADTNDLKAIRGVGSFYAKEVVTLRERLGGYFSYDQLLDVYKIRDETITRIAESTFIDTLAVEKIDVNHCTVEPLGKHPYLSWRQAKVIVSYRQQHGPYQALVEIKETKMIPDSVYRKIAPYLRLE